MGSALSPQNLKTLGWDFLLQKVLILLPTVESLEILLNILFSPFNSNYLLEDLSEGTVIPYFGVLYLQDVASEDSVDPLQLPEQLCNIWDRVVVLGNQPIVAEEGKAVRL